MNNQKRSKTQLQHVLNAVCVIYARYSSHNQKDASIEQQIASATKYANDNGLTVLRTYEDRAVSGTTDNRPAFQNLLRDAEKYQFQYVVAWKSNRIGRNMLQAMVNEERLRECGVKCLYVEEDFADNASGRFALRTMMNVNQFYSENMSEDIRRGLRDNAMNCKHACGAVPFGYKKNDDLTLSIDEERAYIVKEIFERVAAGEQYSDIAADLNRRGIKTGMGRRWGRNSFKSILENEKYKGIYIFDDIRIDGGLPRIVSDDLFDMAQNSIRNRNTTHGRANADYALTGKIFCGDCKSNMVGVCGTSRNGTQHHYYFCMGKRQIPKCESQNVRRDYIEDIVANVIRANCLTDESIATIAKMTVVYCEQQREQSEIGALKHQIASVEKSLDNMLKAIEQGIITPSTKKRMTQLEREREDLELKLREEETQIIDISEQDITDALKKYRPGDIEDEDYRNALFDSFLKAVYVYADHIVVVMNFTGPDNKDLSYTHALADSCSYSDKLTPLNAAHTNTYMKGRFFVSVLKRE